MKKVLNALKRFRDSLGLDESKGNAIALTFVLIFAVTLVTGYFVYLATRGQPEPYTTIYLLDSNRTLEFPERVVIGQNNTFNLWVVAENHMGKTLSFEIRLKITDEADPLFPVNATAVSVYPMTLENGQKSEQLATVSIENPGRCLVVFELWYYNEASVAGFTGNACILNIEAVSA